jgi:LPXTG-motif cell wall-anchored protein
MEGTIASGGTVATVNFNGTPTAAYSGSMAITIPGGVLTSGNSITVTTNPDAKFSILAAAHTGTLAKGKVGVPYAGLAADFGNTWRDDLYPSDSSDWPEGLGFVEDEDGYGFLAGTPSKAGTYVFTVQEIKNYPTVENEWTYSLTIDPRDTIALAGGTAGNYYAANATITVPVSGINLAQIVGALPNGLSAEVEVVTGESNHTISLAITGLPTKSGVYTFGVQLYEGESEVGDPYPYSITINPADHYFVNNVNTYVKGSGLTLVHVTEKELVTHNEMVFVTHAGDASVDAEDQITRDAHYKAEHGSTRITLDPVYLESLAVGPHWLTVGFDDEEEAVQDLFYVAAGPGAREIPPTTQAGEPASVSNPAPKTADDTPLALLVILGGGALAALLALIWLRRRTRGLER